MSAATRSCSSEKSTVINYSITTSNQLQAPPPPKAPAIVDSGADGIYLHILPAASTVTDVRTCLPHEIFPLQVANGTILQPTAIGKLHLPYTKLITATIFQGLSGSLMSIGAVLDALGTDSTSGQRPSATLFTDAMFIEDSKGRTVLTGRRGPISKLWLMDLANPLDTTLLLKQAKAVHGVPVRSL